MMTAAMLVTIAAALLMVSNMRYYSFKEFDLHGRVPFVTVLAVVMAFVLISIQPESVLLIIFGGYAVSGVVETLKQRRRRASACARPQRTAAIQVRSVYSPSRRRVRAIPPR